MYRLDRKKGAGGVLIAVKTANDKLNVIHANTGPGETITLTVQLSPRLIFNICLMYRPPSEQCLDNLEEILLENPSRHYNVLIGDLNFPDIDWSAAPKGSVKPFSKRFVFHKKALDMMKLANMKQLIKVPTHNLGNTLDLVLVAKPLFDDIKFSYSVLSPISDHNTILLEMSTPEKLQSNPKRTMPVRYNFSKAKYDEINLIFDNLHNNIKKNSNDVNSNWNKFTDCIQTCLDNHVPKLKIRKKDKPWWNQELKHLMKLKETAYQEMKKVPTSTNIKLERYYSHQLKVEIRKAKAHYMKTHITDNLESGNTKPLFAHINQAKGQSNCINSIQDTTYDKIPDSIADHFSSVYNSHHYADIAPTVNPLYNKMPDIKVHRQGVLSYLSSLDPRKSTGPDNISPMLLKMFALNVSSFVDIITIIFQGSIDTSVLPPVWKEAVVTPIYKGGPRNDVSNYRPISITSILCKCLEHIISSNVWTHLESNGILSNRQHGFRKGYSTTTQLLHVVHHAVDNLDKRRNSHIVSFDFAKAFDKVPHNLLVCKLVSYKLNMKICDWIKSWLKDRTSVVSVNNLHSKKFQVLSGVPQGSVLGPLLFLLFIEDMPCNVKYSDCRLYADDTLLCCADKNQAQLQEDVNALVVWSCNWGMKFNPKKCVHMQLGKPQPEFTLLINDTPIPPAESIKYLGVHIHHTLKWNFHIEKITKKANRCLGMLRRHISYASHKTKLLAFNAIVRSTLEYACQVWSPHQKGLSKLIDNIHRKGVRWIFQLPRICSVTECMLNHDIVSLYDRRSQLDEKLLRKIEFGDYHIKLNDYITFNTSHNTRQTTISCQHRLDCSRYSYFNRMRPKVKVYFPSHHNTNND